MSSVSWDQWYVEGPPAWEIGRPQSALVELATGGRLAGRVLDVGCGTGEHTILAARHGAQALGVDLSREAIRLAAEKARERGVSVRFKVADALSLHLLHEEFDVVIDSGLFHTFDRHELPRYAASLAGVVRASAIVYVTCISDRQPGNWGPHRVSENDIRSTFGEGWRIEELRECVRERRADLESPTARAWLATIRREAPEGGEAWVDVSGERPYPPVIQSPVMDLDRGHT